MHRNVYAMPLKPIFIMLALVMLTGCSPSDESGSGDHVWKEQTDTLEKARGVEDDLMQSAEKKQRQLEEQTQ